MITRERKEGIPAQYRQGDVFLIAMPLPKDAEPISLEGLPRLALQEGAVTHNCHAIYETKKVTYFSKDSQKYLCVNEPTSVAHEEHVPPIPLPVECYESRIKRQWSVIDEMSEKVID